MSRPLPTTITSNELENDSGIKVAGKITVYNNRIFSDSINLDNCPGDWVPRVYTRNINTITGIDDNAYILDRPVPQDCCWDPATGKLWTVFNVANGIFLMCNGSYNYTRLCDVSGNQYMCYPMCKPAIFPGIIYITDWTGNVIKYTYDFASAVGAPTLNATSATTINSLGYFGTLHD